MNRVRWAAWAVVDIEKLERMQRRNYIKAVREEVKPHSVTLVCGGSKWSPYYQFVVTSERNENKHAAAGPAAFQKACVWLLQTLGEDNERSKDGGLRSAGAEAASYPFD